AWPVARRIRRQYFVDEDDVALRRKAELEFGVGEDDASRLRVRSAMLVQRQCQLSKTPREILTDDPSGLSLADVDVVAAFFLGGRGEDRCRQTIRLSQ